MRPIWPRFRQGRGRSKLPMPMPRTGAARCSRVRSKPWWRRRTIKASHAAGSTAGGLDSIQRHSRFGRAATTTRPERSAPLFSSNLKARHAAPRRRPGRPGHRSTGSVHYPNHAGLQVVLGRCRPASLALDAVRKLCHIEPGDHVARQVERGDGGQRRRRGRDALSRPCRHRRAGSEHAAQHDRSEPAWPQRLPRPSLAWKACEVSQATA